MTAGTKDGVWILTSLKRTCPLFCDPYVAAVRTMPQSVDGWRWNEQLRELGPPPALHARREAWQAAGEWPKRWPEYEEAYQEWMQQPPCARLLDLLEQRLRTGQKVALACWRWLPIHCHLALLGREFQRRGLCGVYE